MIEMRKLVLIEIHKELKEVFSKFALNKEPDIGQFFECIRALGQLIEISDDKLLERFKMQHDNNAEGNA